MADDPAARVKELEEALANIAEGDVPRMIGQRWYADGRHSRHDKCIHNLHLWETCGNCTSNYARSVMEREHA